MEKNNKKHHVGNMYIHVEWHFVNSFYPFAKLFGVDVMNLVDYIQFNSIYNTIYSLIWVASCALLVFGMQVSKNFRIAITSCNGINFIISLIYLITTNCYTISDSASLESFKHSMYI